MAENSYIICKKGKRESKKHVKVCECCKKNTKCDNYIEYLRSKTNKGIIILDPDSGRWEPNNMAYSK